MTKNETEEQHCIVLYVRLWATPLTGMMEGSQTSETNFLK